MKGVTTIGVARFGLNVSADHRGRQLMTTLPKHMATPSSVVCIDVGRIGMSSQCGCLYNFHQGQFTGRVKR